MNNKVQMIPKRRKSPWFKLLILVVVLTTLITVFYYSFRIENIHIGESKYYTNDKLLEYFQEQSIYNNTILTYLDGRFGSHIQIPFIQKYNIVYVDKHTIRYELYDKSIIGCVPYMNEYVYFDKDGEVLEITSEYFKNVPLFEGVYFKEMKLYHKLSVNNENIFNIILDVSQLISLYDIPVSRVILDSRLSVTLECDKIRVILGKKTKYDDTIAELDNVLPSLKGLSGELNLENFVKGQDRIIFKEDS